MSKRKPYEFNIVYDEKPAEGTMTWDALREAVVATLRKVPEPTSEFKTEAASGAWAREAYDGEIKQTTEWYMRRMQRVRGVFIGRGDAAGERFGLEFQQWLVSYWETHARRLVRFFQNKWVGFLEFWDLRARMLLKRRELVLRGRGEPHRIELPLAHEDCIEDGFANETFDGEPEEAAPKRQCRREMPGDGALGYVSGAPYWVVRWARGDALGDASHEASGWTVTLQRPTPVAGTDPVWKLVLEFPPLTPEQLVRDDEAKREAKRVAEAAEKKVAEHKLLVPTAAEAAAVVESDELRELLAGLAKDLENDKLDASRLVVERKSVAEEIADDTKLRADIAAFEKLAKPPASELKKLNKRLRDSGLGNLDAAVRGDLDARIKKSEDLLKRLDRAVYLSGQGKA